MTFAETQESWPFGPAPTRECPKAAAHDWKVIDLFHACEPPVPSFECAHCQYRWSRKWTRAEFRHIILKGKTSDPYYGDGSNYTEEPEYSLTVKTDDRSENEFPKRLL